MRITILGLEEYPRDFLIEHYSDQIEKVTSASITFKPEVRLTTMEDCIALLIPDKSNDNITVIEEERILHCDYWRIEIG